MENSENKCLVEEDEIITPAEYLRRQAEQEAEARDALPGAFTECTFNLGPLNQPTYVCLTCKQDESVKEKGPAGICYSCSISCHTDHELLELFNKRDSVCECGTRKFPFKCALEKGICSIPKGSTVKHAVDSDGWRHTVTSNHYTHNHEGRYCWCDKSYDPEVEEDTMIQCLDCQDWFHQLCIGKYAPEEESDFICSTCVQKHPALLPYLATDKFSAVYRTGEPLEEAQAEPPSVADTTSQPIDEASLAAPPTGSKRPNEGGDLPPSSKPRLEPPSAAIDAEGTTCSKPSMPYNGCGKREFSIVAKKEWRGDVCRCNKCLDAYCEQDMSHLIDIEEVYVPEEDPNGDVSLHDAGLQALGALPLDQAILLANGYDQLRSRMQEFLRPFAGSNKTITKEDILKIFKGESDP